MNNCTQCGSQIPSPQRVCSMCYGDIDYGKDGYYREWAEKQMGPEVQEIDLEQQQIEDQTE